MPIEWCAFVKTDVEAQRAPISSSTLQYCHLRKSAAAEFLRRGHPENADAAEAVDHVRAEYPPCDRSPPDRDFHREIARSSVSAIEFGLLRGGMRG